MTALAPDLTAALPAFPDPADARVYDDAFALVGNTPLVRINRVAPDAAAAVYVKLDQFNLGGSSKDRIGINIVREAIASGQLRPGQRIVDFGAGNTAIGYALAGQATGHPVTIVANPTLSPEKANLLLLLGVDIVPGRSDVPAGHPDHWAAISERYEQEDPSNWWARQESATSNPHSHALSTGPEIWAQTGGRVTHFLAAVATGGTVSGTGAYLKSQNPDVQVIATDFAEKADKTNARAYIERRPGYEQLERDFPANYDLDVIDRLETRTKADVIAFGWEVARTEGLLLGTSSILSLLAALDIARDAAPDDVIVSFAADSGRDYLTREYNAGWLRENGFAAVADRFA
ncbi:PLP-dependent cysteine synthase family protein [Microbacterium terrisoli]|jgi:cysteine synthase|uniref:PLP-dependent cysteine synthase family protein n=1 Tax=Microbacterium terrisoli TaxID=3242192 RepID=UPI002804C510|nr:cysteine synthase family protein [Microbacterium protaetiae]